MIELQSHQYGPRNGGKPKSIVVALHGLGANGQDLLGLAPLFADALPDTLFLAPDAPFPCDMAPYGRQWFSLQQWTYESMLRGIQTAMPILNNYIDRALAQYGLDDSHLALVGFSQGTMMSLYAGPRRKDRIAGILGYSGALVWETDIDPAHLQLPPVHLIHGAADTVVPLAAYHAAKQMLEGSGFTLSGGITSGLAHNIDDAGIQSGRAFLSQVLG